MGMYTYVMGYREPDEEYKTMKAIYEGCVKMNLDPPDEVLKYFDYSAPNQYGEPVVIDNALLVKGDQGSHDMQMVWDVDVTKLPEDVTVIRFCNSY